MTDQPLNEDEVERLHELTALDVYGELDGAETRELARLRKRAPERAAAATADLDQGLARLARARGDASPELPPGWHERLAREIAPRRAARITPWLGVAAGFVAGAFLVWSTHSPAAPTATGPVARAPSHEFARFATESAPPLATAGGELAGLASYLR